MSWKVMAFDGSPRERPITPAESKARSEFDKASSTSDWCDLNPKVDITPDGDDGFATVRL
jgi:hypothetical protein